MNESRRFDFENPWLFVFTNIAVGLVVASIVQTVLFDGELTGAVIEGAVLGLTTGVTLLFFRKNGDF